MLWPHSLLEVSHLAGRSPSHKERTHGEELMLIHYDQQSQLTFSPTTSTNCQPCEVPSWSKLSIPGKLSDDCIPVNNLTETSWETLSRNHPPKLLPDSWPSETKWDNKGLLFQLTEFGAICYVARANWCRDWEGEGERGIVYNRS